MDDLRSDSSDDEATSRHQCPECGEAFDAERNPPARGFLQCPSCGAQFVVSDEPVDDAFNEPDREPSEIRIDEDRGADELDGVRIRKLTALRRAAFRARTHTLVGAVVCAVAVVQSVILTIREVYAAGINAWSATYLLLAAIAGVGCPYFFRRSRAIGREIGEMSSATSEPLPGEPDFSPLSDGSQHSRNLDQM